MIHQNIFSDSISQKLRPQDGLWYALSLIENYWQHWDHGFPLKTLDGALKPCQCNPFISPWIAISGHNLLAQKMKLSWAGTSTVPLHLQDHWLAPTGGTDGRGSWMGWLNLTFKTHNRKQHWGRLPHPILSTQLCPKRRSSTLTIVKKTFQTNLVSEFWCNSCLSLWV